VRLSIDSNILVYAYDSEAGMRHREAVALMTRAALANGVLTLQGLAEFFSVTTRKGKLRPAHASAAVDRMLAMFEIHTADTTTLSDAVQAVVAHHLPFWDAMLWATVQRAGCSMLLTEDFQDRRRLGAVTFVNPFDPANAALLDRSSGRAAFALAPDRPGHGLALSDRARSELAVPDVLDPRELPTAPPGPIVLPVP